MRLEDELKLSFYKELTAIDRHRRVILTEHVETRRLFVKKVLNTYDRGIYEILQRERFPQVPKIAELIEDTDRDELIVIEEYIDGQSLEQRLEQRLGAEETVDIIRQLCRILQPLHEHDPKIIHRDIKPSNLVWSEGRLWLIDFDAARDVQPERRRDTVLMGTEDYAAPEQFGFAQSTERTDIYAIGVTMNRLLTGRFPLEQIAEGPLGDVIRTCTAMDPKDRYQSVRELEAALTAAETGTRTGAGAEQTAQPSPETEGSRNPLIRLIQDIPGFRSHKPGRMVVISIVYLLILLTLFTVPITHKDGSAVGLAEETVNHLAMILIVFGIIFYLGNFKGWRNVFPFRSLRNPVIDVLRIILGAAIIFFLPLYLVVTLFPD